MTQANKIRALKLNDLGDNRNEYGINSRNNPLNHFKQSYLPTSAKSEIQLQMKRQYSAPQKDIPPLMISSTKNSRRIPLKQQPEQQTERQRLLNVQKQQTYRNQIHELIKQNESLKLKQRQSQIRADELQLKLKQHLQSSQEGRRQRTSLSSQQSQQIYENEEYAPQLFSKYHLPIKRMLELYGCSREQTSIEGCHSEGEIIMFLVKLLSERWQDFNSKSRQNRDKLAKQQRQVSKVRDSLRMLSDTIELFKHRENKHKEKMEEARRDWATTCEKLSRSENIRQKLELDQMKLEKALQQQQAEMIRIQEDNKARHDQQLNNIEQLEIKVIEANGQFNRLQVKYQQLESDLDETRQLAEEWRLKLKVKEDELYRTNRQVVRWKQRFDWMEKDRAGVIDETIRSLAQSKVVFNGPTSKEMVKSELEMIKESSGDVRSSKQLKKTRFPEDMSKPIEQASYIDKKTLNNKYSMRSEVVLHRQAELNQTNEQNHAKKYPFRRILTSIDTQMHSPESVETPADQASNLMQNMLSKLEVYANKVTDKY